jgi:hypothetical protein
MENEINIRTVVQFGPVRAGAAARQAPARVGSGHRRTGRAVDADFVLDRYRPADAWNDEVPATFAGGWEDGDRRAGVVDPVAQCAVRRGGWKRRTHVGQTTTALARMFDYGGGGSCIGMPLGRVNRAAAEVVLTRGAASRTPHQRLLAALVQILISPV